MLLAEVENILLKRKPNLIIALLFIQNVSKFWIRLPPRRLPSDLVPVSSRVSWYKEMFFLAGTPQTSKSIQNPSSEMFSVFLYFFRSDLIRLKLFRLWITLSAIIFSSLVNKRLRFQLNLPSINLVSNQIYHRIDGMLLASSKYGKHQSGISNEIVFVEFCF